MTLPSISHLIQDFKYMTINLGYLKNMSKDVQAILYLNIFICFGANAIFLYLLDDACVHVSCIKREILYLKGKNVMHVLPRTLHLSVRNNSQIPVRNKYPQLKELFRIISNDIHNNNEINQNIKIKSIFIKVKEGI